MFAKNLTQLRKKANISQDKLAEVLGVSRQAVQKWESGASMPDIENLKALAEHLDVSIDYLLCNKDLRSVEQLRVDHRAEPAYEAWNRWEDYSKDLAVEYRQCKDEGKTVEPYEAYIQIHEEMQQFAKKNIEIMGFQENVPRKNKKKCNCCKYTKIASFE